MSDEEENEENEEVIALQQEVDSWKAKYKTQELKKRESELALNKIKTEINSLRSVDKLWKDASKTIYYNLKDMQHLFNAQIDQIEDGLSGLTVAGERVSSKVPYMKLIKKVIANLQTKIALQEESIMNLNSRIRLLSAELQEKTAKVERLSQGIEEEVERLIRPMREKLSETMVLLMKEKAARAQERRDLADLWPNTHMMPTLLMKYRSLTDEERENRIQFVLQQNASLALSLEVKANVMESKLWEIKYDDYGRPFYQHMKTGETSQDPPEIMNYIPPPGRDEFGNAIITEENDSRNWMILTDNKGEVYYKHKFSGETSKIAPYTYVKLPPGKPREEIVAESAQIVLEFIKEKISKHIEIKKKRKFDCENPLTAEERKKKEKRDRNKTADEIAAETAHLSVEGELIDLNLYQYDIETVEMLATALSNNSTKKDENKEGDDETIDTRAFLQENSVRTFDEELYEGQSLMEIDQNELSIDRLRGIVEELAVKEENFERKLNRTRVNLKDFSFLLTEKITQENKEKIKALQEEKLNIEKERRANLKKLLAERRAMQKQLEEARDKEIKERAERGEIIEPGNEESKLSTSEKNPSVKNSGSSKKSNVAQEKIIEDTGIALSENVENQPSESAKSRISNNEAQEESSQSQKDIEEKEGIEENKEDKEDKEDILDDPDAVLPKDLDEEEFDESKFEDLEKPIEPISEEELKKELFGERHSIILSEIKIQSSEYDCSPDLITLTTNLSHFALFCGFTNLPIDDYVFGANSNYSLLADHLSSPNSHISVPSSSQRPSKHAQSNHRRYLSEDDEYLTANFFLSCSMKQLETLQLLHSNFEDKVGHLPIGSFSTPTHTFETRNDRPNIRKMNHSYTFLSKNITENGLNRYFQLWKAQQLMQDVVFNQIQEEAIELIHQYPNEAFVSEKPKPANLSRIKETPKVLLQISHIKYVPVEKPITVLPNKYFVRFKLANWTKRTSFVNPNPLGANWGDLNIQGEVDLNNIQLDDLFFEILDEEPDDPNKVIVGKGNIEISNIAGSHFGHYVNFKVPVYDSHQVSIGEFFLEICGLVDFQPVTQLSSDPFELQRHEVLRVTQLPVKPIITEGVTQSQKSQKRMQATDTLTSIQEPQFRNLLNELRGDTCTLTKQLIQEIPLENILLDIQTNDIKLPTSMRKLPNFENATRFLERKLQIHTKTLHHIETLIESRQPVLLEYIKSRNEVIQRQLTDVKGKFKKLFDQSEDIKKDVQRVMKNSNDLKIPHVEPKEPVFPEFPPIPLVPQLPASGGLDSRGKKKKALQPNDLTKIIDDVQSGALDGIEIWPFPENLFPNQAQIVKINKAIEVRNQILQNKRKDELSQRHRLLDLYQADHDRWEAMEKKRNLDLDKMKKECRKYNIKYDACTTKLSYHQIEIDGLETDYKSFVDMKISNEKSMDKFKSIKCKIYLENNRQETYIQQCKDKLLRLLNTRKYLLEVPKTAKTLVEFEELQTQITGQLKLIRLEIFQTKQELILEGQKLHTLMNEEMILTQSELNRINLCIEIIQQRDCYLQIIHSYKIDIINLYVSLEKYKLIESDKDEIGLDTIEDQGEKYKIDKIWTSPDIHKINKMIEVYLHKINLTEGYARSTALSQRQIVDHLISLYGDPHYTFFESSSCGFAYSSYSGFNSFSFVEQAEWQRSHQTLQSAIRYIQQQRKIMKETFQQENGNKLLELSYQNDLLANQLQSINSNYHLEMSNVKNNTIIVLHSIREYLQNYRHETQDKLHFFELSIVNLSKECSRIREELLSQQMMADEKMKLLWAFIYTLQTALQQLSAKMEIIIEEREKIVIQAKLIADNTRHQLKIERKHNSNLLMMLHTQRGFVQYLYAVIKKLTLINTQQLNQERTEKFLIRKELWEHIFTFSRLSTDVDLLFEFFATRLANLAGSRVTYNDALAYNNAAMVLAALCKNPKPIVRRSAARALGQLGWNSYVETRILLWDCVMYWKMLKQKIIAQEQSEFNSTLSSYYKSNKFEAILNTGEKDIPSQKRRKQSTSSSKSRSRNASRKSSVVSLNYKRKKSGVSIGSSSIPFSEKKEIKNDEEDEDDDDEDDELDEDEEFIPSGNMSLRSIIKNRRQWALRAVRRLESPNILNQKLLNVKDGVLINLLQLCVTEDHVQSFDPMNIKLDDNEDGFDWEIARNAALAIAIASYESSNHHDMLHTPLCLDMLLNMCVMKDVEIQTHAAVTVANLSFLNEEAQLLFGEKGIIEILLELLSSKVADVLEAATCALANLTSNCDINCQRLVRNKIPSTGFSGIKQVISVIITQYSENLLDMDQNDEVHANASEVLANVSRFNRSSETNLHEFLADETTIDSLVIMCASSNKQLKRHISLVLGNIAQDERCRHEIGSKGGIEALFLILEDKDPIIQSNSLWALANLMWHPPNQERAGRFMIEIVKLLSNSQESPGCESLRVNAALLLGNVLYYNTENRVRFLEIDGAFEMLLNFILMPIKQSELLSDLQRKQFELTNENPSLSPRSIPPPMSPKDSFKAAASSSMIQIVESCLRSLLSLSYLDSIALWLGETANPLISNYNLTLNASIDMKSPSNSQMASRTGSQYPSRAGSLSAAPLVLPGSSAPQPKLNEDETGGYIPLLIKYLELPYYSRDCMRYSLEILCNLCLHHANRHFILTHSGIDRIVPLHADKDEHIRTLSVQIIGYLEDITPKEVLLAKQSNIGLERWVSLISNAPVANGTNLDKSSAFNPTDSLNNSASINLSGLHGDPLVKAVAAEAIGEEVFANSRNQQLAHQIGAIDSLLLIIKEFPTETVQALLPSIWSLRNAINNYPPGQSQFALRGGIEILTHFLRYVSSTGNYLQHTEKLIESSLLCFISAINNHPENSRALVLRSLDVLLQLHKDSTPLLEKSPLFNGNENIKYVVQSIQSESIQTLLSHLFLLVAPYNYVVCRNCQRKQDLHGTNCFHCGHRLLIDVPGAENIESPDKFIDAIKSNSLPPWRHGGKAPPPTMKTSNSTPAITIPSQVPKTTEIKNESTSPILTSKTERNPSRSYFSRTLPLKNNFMPNEEIAMGEQKQSQTSRPKT